MKLLAASGQGILMIEKNFTQSTKSENAKNAKC